MTFSAPGFDAVSHDAKIRVGEGVDLAAGPGTKVSAAPGGKFTSALKVSNTGETTAKGASVVFYNDYGILADKHYSNCTYVDDTLRSCHFDEDLAPDATYGVNLAYRLGKDTYAPGSQVGEIVWMTPAEFEDYEAYLDSAGFRRASRDRREAHPRRAPHEVRSPRVPGRHRPGKQPVPA